MGIEQPRRTVLVVDDEPLVREIVADYLQREGFAVTEAADGRAALEALETGTPDLVLLDVMLPHVDGFTILTALRRRGDIPVILLTARSDETDRVLGLELGADDYVVKPFSPREVAARVRSVLRRTEGARASDGAGGRLAFEGLVIDLDTRDVTVDGEPVVLTAREFDLLAFLAASPRQVFSRGQLLQQVWGSSPDWQDPSTVTVHVRRIRRKIEADPQAPRRIVTVWGVGYRFEP